MNDFQFMYGYRCTCILSSDPTTDLTMWLLEKLSNHNKDITAEFGDATKYVVQSMVFYHTVNEKNALRNIFAKQAAYPCMSNRSSTA